MIQLNDLFCQRKGSYRTDLETGFTGGALILNDIHDIIGGGPEVDLLFVFKSLKDAAVADAAVAEKIDSLRDIA